MTDRLFDEELVRRLTVGVFGQSIAFGGTDVTTARGRVIRFLAMLDDEGLLVTPEKMRQVSTHEPDGDAEPA